MSEPLVLTIEEAAKALRVGRTAAYEAVRRGDIPAVRIGRTLRVPRERLMELLDLSKNNDATAGNGGVEKVRDDGSQREA